MCSCVVFYMCSSIYVFVEKVNVKYSMQSYLNKYFQGTGSDTQMSTNDGIVIITCVQWYCKYVLKCVKPFNVRSLGDFLTFPPALDQMTFISVKPMMIMLKKMGKVFVTSTEIPFTSHEASFFNLYKLIHLY